VLAAGVGATLLLTSCGSSSHSSSPTVSTTTASPPPVSTAPTPPGTTTTPSAGKLTPAARLILKLLKTPKASELPNSLKGSMTQATPLSPGSKANHAAGAIATTNGGALVGYLVFKNRSDALADLKAYPPDSGPNKIVGRNMTGLPHPTYVLRALGNGYLARYVVFVDGPVVVNTWAYGRKGKASERKLETIVAANAQWARRHLAAARKAAGVNA
jgi:hypothetical protein